MAETIREQIICALTEHLKTITKFNGYNTDIGQKLDRGRRTFDVSELPAVNVLPRHEEAEQRFNKHHCTMEIRIEGVVQYGKNNPSVISELILGDLISCVSDTSLKKTATANLADSLLYIRGGVDDYPDESHNKVGAFAVFQIRYFTLSGNPYKQKQDP